MCKDDKTSTGCQRVMAEYCAEHGDEDGGCEYVVPLFKHTVDVVSTMSMHTYHLAEPVPKLHFVNDNCLCSDKECILGAQGIDIMHVDRWGGAHDLGVTFVAHRVAHFKLCDHQVHVANLVTMESHCRFNPKRTWVTWGEQACKGDVPSFLNYVLVDGSVGAAN